MINKLKYRSIEREYNKAINLPVTSDTQQTHTKVKTVAVLLDNPALVNVIRANLTNKLPFHQDRITFLVFQKDKKEEEEDLLSYSEKEIGFNASLKSDILQNFVQKKYDLLINYTKSTNLYTNIITLYSKAKLKAGFASVDDRLYDLIVSDTAFNEAVLNQELKKYLTILNKI